MANDFTIIVEDRPGELARVGEAPGNARVNIEAVAGVVTNGGGVVHVVVEDADAARSALDGAGIDVARDRTPGSPTSWAERTNPERSAEWPVRLPMPA
jgi:hypothetical protein